MSKLAKYDQNMASETGTIRDERLYFPDPFAPPFRLSGFYWYNRDGKLHRLPAHIAKEVSEGVAYLATQTAGGMLMFRTNSNRLYIEATVVEAELSQKFTACGRCGFDVYMRRDDFDRLIYVKTVLPDPGVKHMRLDIPDIGSLMLEGSSDIVEILINFPPYDGVEQLLVGLDNGASVLEPAPYAVEKPIVFYGSSITQGGCASRPGNAYTNHLARRLNAPIINLGFSGSGRGEPLMAQTIADMDMSAFVMDYDHNAPSPEHLEKTHEPFFKIIREKVPTLPIIMISRVSPNHKMTSVRREIIRCTYNNAITAGDKNVYFIDGETLFGTTDRDACTVDGTHPNDLGFLRMADGIEPVLRQALDL
ncbi:MAG: hypothetical protein IJO45_00920 [Oscillospiraceae bacterium]|nr:hypothetical protein [Oscillospiraceae bacterium]